MELVAAKNGEIYLNTMSRQGRSESQCIIFLNISCQFWSRLRRIYVLFSAKHGLNEMDKIMLRSLNEQCQISDGRNLTLQGIITKADTLSPESVKQVKKMQDDIFEAAPTCLPAIVTIASKYPFFGIEEVRKSIVEACGVGRVDSRVRVS